jgi:hypothetical protein
MWFDFEHHSVKGAHYKWRIVTTFSHCKCCRRILIILKILARLSNGHCALLGYYACVITQKSAALTYFAGEAWNHSRCQRNSTILLFYNACNTVIILMTIIQCKHNLSKESRSVTQYLKPRPSQIKIYAFLFVSVYTLSMQHWCSTIAALSRALSQPGINLTS